MKKILAILFILMNLLPLICLSVEIKADNKKQSIVFVGDSRTVGMKNAIGADLAEQFTWICEVGKAGNWVKESSQWNTLTSISDKSSTIVVYLMGINSLNVSQESGVANDIANLGFKEVYFVETLGVEPSRYPPGSYSTKNKEVIEFNNAISSVSNKKYKIMPMYASISTSNTTDGIHYDEASYNKMFELITSQLGITSNGVTSEFRVALKNYLGKEPTDADLHNYSFIIEALRTDGFTDIAIAGLAGNIRAESSSTYGIEAYWGTKSLQDCTFHYFEEGNSYDMGDAKPSSVNENGEISGVGHGIVQWSFSRAHRLINFAEENKDIFNSVTITHYVYCSYNNTINPINNKAYNNWAKETCRIPNIAGQVSFMLEELNATYKSVKDNINNASTVYDASTEVLLNYESPHNKDSQETKNLRADYGEKFLEVIKHYTGIVYTTQGTNGVDNNNSDVQALTQYMKLKGYWTEQEISSFTKLSEANIEKILTSVSRDALTGNQLESLKTWEDIVSDVSKQGGVLYWFRVIIMWLGILMVVWAVLLYVGFWFDRANNFLDFSIVTILTLGKLTVSDTDEESTFGKKNVEGVKSISSRQLTVICLSCICVGALIISGIFYRLISALVNCVTRLIS